MQAVIFVGIQAIGKSTFYLRRFFRTHVRINLDMLRTRHRERLMIQACADAKQPFVADNTNPTLADRERYIGAAKAADFKVIGYYFRSDVDAALAYNSASFRQACKTFAALAPRVVPMGEGRARAGGALGHRLGAVGGLVGFEPQGSWGGYERVPLLPLRLLGKPT